MKKVAMLFLCASMFLGTGMTVAEGEVLQATAKETIVEAGVVGTSSALILQTCGAAVASTWLDDLIGVTKPNEAVSASCNCTTDDRENCQRACSFTPGCTAHSFCNPPSSYCECLCLNQYNAICEVDGIEPEL
jgi:hypothetical protein